MKRIAFVILHYNVPEVTRQCVASIKMLDCDVQRNIVIVDNGSPDGSGRLLEEEYALYPDIKVILTGENLGFARGNNVGYRYAKEQCRSDVIVVTNNDILFEQRDFILKLNNLMDGRGCSGENGVGKPELEPYGVVGPDIVTLAQEHQNPFRISVYTLSDVKRVIRNKRVFLAYFNLKKYLHLDQRIFVLENLFERKSEKRRADIAWDKDWTDVVLQGACMIFLPRFVENEMDAFCSDTFMYGEEDILSYVCQKKGYRTAYLHELHVLHLEGKATKEHFGKSVEKNMFIYKHTINSLRVLKRMMQDNQ